MNSLKVMMLTQTTSGGGAERVLTALANAFAEKGFDVSYVTFQENGYYTISEQIKKIVINKSKADEIICLRKLIKKEKFSIIISFLHPVTVKCQLALFGMKNKPVVIASERGDPYSNSMNSIRNLLRIIAYIRCDLLVFQTQEAMDYFGNRIAKKGIVIPNPIRDDLPEPYYGVKEKRIVAVGRLEKQKNFPLLLTAYKRVHEEFPDYQLYIYGEGSLREELNALSVELGIDNFVFFPGFVKHIEDQIKNAALYVSSSDYEGISNSMIEAMALGIPTVCTDCPIGGARLMIKDNENGILVPVGEKEALAEAMIKVLSNQELAKRISSAAIEIRSEYSIDTISDKWINEIIHFQK